MLHPHPLCNHDAHFDNGQMFLKISPCVICLCEFPHNDMIMSVYKQLYHPWCVLMHFKQNIKCTYFHYVPYYVP
jgi:hypothetical protein